jgi:Ca2+-binding RTX toxin-like protein
LAIFRYLGPLPETASYYSLIFIGADFNETRTRVTGTNLNGDRVVYSGFFGGAFERIDTISVTGQLSITGIGITDSWGWWRQPQWLIDRLLAGDDEFYGTDANEVFSSDPGFGSPANSEAPAGDDLIEAGGGDDTVFASGGNDLVDGGAGRDTYRAEFVYTESTGFRANLSATPIDLAAVVSMITGAPATPQAIAGLQRYGAQIGTLDPAEVHDGYGGRDIISGFEIIFGTGANDVIVLGVDEDDIDGGPADDILIGTGGAIRLSGDFGDDLLVGAAGDDSLLGGPGDDFMSGGGGDDWLQYSSGAATMVGGEGSYTLVAFSRSDSVLFVVDEPASRNETPDHIAFLRDIDRVFWDGRGLPGQSIVIAKDDYSRLIFFDASNERTGAVTFGDVEIDTEGQILAVTPARFLGRDVLELGFVDVEPAARTLAERMGPELRTALCTGLPIIEALYTLGQLRAQADQIAGSGIARWMGLPDDTPNPFAALVSRLASRDFTPAEVAAIALVMSERMTDFPKTYIDAILNQVQQRLLTGEYNGADFGVDVITGILSEIADCPDNPDSLLLSVARQVLSPFAATPLAGGTLAALAVGEALINAMAGAMAVRLDEEHKRLMEEMPRILRVEIAEGVFAERVTGEADQTTDPQDEATDDILIWETPLDMPPLTRDFRMAPGKDDLIIDSVAGTGGFASLGRVAELAHRVVGNALDNRIAGSDLPDALSGLGGDDWLRGLDDDDRLDGGVGNDTLEGGDGADTLNGGDGDDVIRGGDTAADLRDVIYGGAGNDRIDAGHGNDLVYGGDGDDTVEGGFGVDEIIGQGGNDVLTGSAFSDLIFGGDGDDFINGGFGSDRVNGGAGADRFYHLGIADHGSDWIQDYNAADGDVLVWGGGAATRAQFQVNTTETAGAGAAGVDEAFVIYRPTGQILWALVDGGAQGSINLQIGGQVFDLL